MLFTYLTGNFTSSGVQVYNLILLSFFQLLSYSVTQHTKFIFSFTHVEWSGSSTTTLHLTNIAVRGKKFKRNHRVCRTGSIYVFLNVSNNVLSLLGCSCRSCNTSSQVREDFAKSQVLKLYQGHRKCYGKKTTSKTHTIIPIKYRTQTIICRLV